jgi:hypothetical protein
MNIERLKKVLLLPPEPEGRPTTQQWKNFPCHFPPDYMEFMEYYGSGHIESFIHVLSPFEARADYNVFKHLGQVVRINALLHSATPSQVNNTVYYPETEGLLPFAVTESQLTCFWRTGGAPEDWDIYIGERGEAFTGMRKLKQKTLEFLYSFIVKPKAVGFTYKMPKMARYCIPA